MVRVFFGTILLGTAACVPEPGDACASDADCGGSMFCVVEGGDELGACEIVERDISAQAYGDRNGLGNDPQLDIEKR